MQTSSVGWLRRNGERRPAPVSATTASRSAFDGIVPVFTQTPPSICPRSTIATRAPSFAVWMAAFCPAGPEPIATRS